MMLRIAEKDVVHLGYLVDYKLENGVLLYDMDWNGERYNEGFDPRLVRNTGMAYLPIYVEVAEDEFEIVGFEEMQN